MGNWVCQGHESSMSWFLLHHMARKMEKTGSFQKSSSCVEMPRNRFQSNCNKTEFHWTQSEVDGKWKILTVSMENWLQTFRKIVGNVKELIFGRTGLTNENWWGILRCQVGVRMCGMDEKIGFWLLIATCLPLFVNENVIRWLLHLELGQ